jgi:Na+-driven multidrug efflux pump
MKSDNSPIGKEKAAEASSDIVVSNEDRELGTKNVKGLLIKYAGMAILGQLSEISWIIMDGIFVGDTMGEVGLAAMGIVSPLYVFGQAIGLMIAVGATTSSGIYLGQGKKERAREIFGQSIFYVLILSAIISAIVLPNADMVARLMGATPDLVPQAAGFIKAYFCAFPIVILGFLLYEYARLDEKPVLAASVLIFPTFLAMYFDWYWYYNTNIGIASSGFSYDIDVGAWALPGLYFFFSKKTIFKLKLRDIKFKLKDLGEINRNGIASLGIQLSFFVLGLVTNNLLAVYGTTMDKAAFGVLNGYLLNIFVCIVTIGFTIGIQPLASFNFGARRFDRVRDAYKWCMIYAVTIMAALTAVLFIFGKQCIGVFTGFDEDLINATTGPMHITMVLFALGTASMISSSYFQAIEQAGKATFNSMTRNLIFAVPFSFIMAHVLGVTGVWAAYPIADSLAGIIGFIMMAKELKRLKKLWEAEKASKGPIADEKTADV